LHELLFSHQMLQLLSSLHYAFFFKLSIHIHQDIGSIKLSLINTSGSTRNKFTYCSSSLARALVIVMRTSHLLIHLLHLHRNTHKDLSLELMPSNLTIRYFHFLELFLTYVRI
jgi:hypothetical protein